MSGTVGADPRRWWALPVILCGTLMASFDFMVVNVAAPSLRQDLHAGPAALELVIGGYGFTYAAGLVTGGRLGDLFGRRRVFLAGMAGFALASLWCGLSGSAGLLVAARLVQGLTAAVLVPQVLALVTALFPAPERARALSWFGVVLGVGGIAGQVGGGLLLHADLLGLTWRPIFLVNVPVGAVAVTLAARWLPRDTHRTAVGWRRLDPVGAVGVAVGLGLALVPLVLGRDQGWPVWSWVSLAAAGPVLAAVLGWEWSLGRRGRAPVVDLALFGKRSFRLGMGIAVAMLASVGGLMFVLTLLLQNGLGLGPLAAGLAFTPMGVTAMVGSVFGRRLADRYGLVVLTVGGLLNAAGVLGLAAAVAVAGTALGALWTVLPFALIGLGQGLVLPSLIGVVLSEVPAAKAGAASGMLTTGQQFAGATGVAVLGAVYFAALGTHPASGAPARAGGTALWVDLALVLAMTALTALLLRRRTPAVSATPAAPAPQAVPASPAATAGRTCPAEPVLDRRI
jgi:MFS family permease